VTDALESLAMGLIDGLEANNLSVQLQQCVADGSRTSADVAVLIDDLKHHWTSIVGQMYKVLSDLIGD